MGDFNALPPTLSSEMTPLTNLLGEVDDTANTYNPYAWTNTFNDTSPDRKIDYILYGRAKIGNTVNYNIVGIKFGPAGPDFSTESDFDQQALFGPRMYVR